MHKILKDRFDHAILKALQEDSTCTNAELAEIVHLSASQCSRRRARLESEGLIAGYTARLDARALGFGLRAVIRVSLAAHGENQAADFHALLASCREVRSAFSVSGDADYILLVLTEDLDSFSDFVHERLLPHPQIMQVRSEIVLKVLKEEPGVPL
ncbi:AsnC family transcriptional regulator [Notoacmeibacter marinus]|uniref:AsnC family transcriptional regulator n=1 Tax=Notoacmeibacter marinus TaxID=1876515 RepID=A0A231V3E9_9HYPH|nr:Lrp/AsnC family transcriptional regulator [Notoacmeibacter marinus]OXT02708.1 AsnC family transcriptional regulator [Notoacmeibacter marinus]